MKILSHESLDLANLFKLNCTFPSNETVTGVNLTSTLFHIFKLSVLKWKGTPRLAETVLIKTHFKNILF